MCWYVYDNIGVEIKRTTCRHWFFLSTMQVTGIELMSSDLASSIFILLVILLDHVVVLFRLGPSHTGWYYQWLSLISPPKLSNLENLADISGTNLVYKLPVMLKKLVSKKSLDPVKLTININCHHLKVLWRDFVSEHSHGSFPTSLHFHPASCSASSAPWSCWLGIQSCFIP